MDLDGQAAQRASGGADHSRLDDGGFVLVALLVGIAVSSIWMAAALPSWRQQVIRQREHELIFRGQQYARAIRLYQQQMGGTLPTSLDDLVSQNFLRRKYKDPITDDEFLPRVGCMQPGNFGQPGRGTPVVPGRGVPTMPGGGGPVTPGGGGPIGFPRGGRMSQVDSPSVLFELAQAPGRGAPPMPPPMPPPGNPPRQGGPIQPGRGTPQPGGGRFPGQMPGQFPGQIGAQGGGICGVQSKSKATSIVIYNGQQQHDLWQFDTTTAAMLYQRAIVRLGGGIQPGQGGMPGGIGGPPFGPGGGIQNPNMPGRGFPGRRGGQNPTVPGRGFGPGGQFPPGGGQPGAPPTLPGGRRGN